MSKTKKKRSKAYNIIKTVKEQNIIQPKRTKTKKIKKVKDVKMDRVQQHKQKRSKTVKIKKSLRSWPPPL